MLSGANEDDSAYCTLCKVQFFVCHGGDKDVRKHFSTVKHVSAPTASKPDCSLYKFGFGNSEATKAARQQAEERNCKVQNAEALFAQFIAEHSLPHW